MIAKNEEIDWSLTTWKGSRRQQHQQYLALSFRQKLENLESLCDLSRSFLAQRQQAGLPYIDPYTGQVVRPAKDPG